MESLISSGHGLCSIELGPEGIAFANAPNPNNLEISACGFYPYQFGSSPDVSKLRDQLLQVVSQNGLKKTKCVWILHPSYYRLTLIGTPNVPQAEYKKAIRWQIKDIINYSLEDTAVDIFYPDEPERSLKKIYVIAAQSSFLKNIANTIQDCGLYLEAIDTREFAIRNLITDLSKPGETTGLLNIIDESCLMMSVKQSNVQFVRRFPVNANNIKAGNYSDLMSEIQRSFNYCQTELKQEIPTKFVIPPDAILDKNVAQEIAKNLNKEVNILNLQEVVRYKKPLDQQMEPRCWIAIGGVLRNARQSK